MEQLNREVLSLLLHSPETEYCRDIQELFYKLGPLGTLCQHLRITNAGRLEKLLQRCSLLQVEDDGEDLPLVTPKTSLTICKVHSNKSGSCPEGGTCGGLHFCVFQLLSGECEYRGECLFGHEIRTRHNHALLQKHGLHFLSSTDLRTLFALPTVRQGVLLPRICIFYNKMMGCSKGDKCRALHLCAHYVQDSCKFARRCDRNHNIDDYQVTNVLTLYGVKVNGRKKSDLLREVRIYDRKCSAENEADRRNANHDGRIGSRSRTSGEAHSQAKFRSGSVPNLFSGQKFTIPTQGGSNRAPSAGRRPRTCSESAYSQLAGQGPRSIEEICIYALKGTCNNRERCPRLHSDAPFLWRLQADTGAVHSAHSDAGPEWYSLPPATNRRLETAYCQPQVKECIITNSAGDEVTVDFHNMIARNQWTEEKHRVRRVSTKSTMDAGLRGAAPSNPHREFATKWLWYWRNQDGRWSEFGQEQNERLPISSSLLEENYQINHEAPFISYPFVLDFCKLRLKDERRGQKFRVKRRPLKPAPLENHYTPWSTVESDLEDSDSHGKNQDDDDDDDEEEKDNAARAPSSDLSDDIDDIDGIDDGGRAADLSASHNNFLSPIHMKSKKFQEIKQKFINTLGVACTRLSIHSVNNPLLKASYKRMKSSSSWQTKSRQGQRQKQKQPQLKDLSLFYGPTHGEDIHAVSKNGPNCNDDQTGNYVKGGYFHVNAAQANKDITETGGRGAKQERCMFLMKCLVGPSLLGSDWVVDDNRSPKTYLTSNSCLVCPDYAITYKLA